ncbi:cytochrome P450 [Stipitochalara longipes BDJ]|nr:cytochrome P450 [Stipitochalara longipes BDJ]
MGLLSALSFGDIVMALFLFSTAYTAALVSYRLYFHPLAKFPGSVLARSTFLYEFGHTYFGKGTYYLKVKEMHRKYGPVVRITPDELHVDDPSFFHTLFVHHATRKTENYPRASDGTGFEDMIAISQDHDMHRQARGVLDPFFSKAKLTKMEQRVQDRVQILCDRFRSIQGTDTVVNITNAINSLTSDSVSSLIFEDPSDYLGDADFNETYFSRLKSGVLSVPIFAHLPWFAKVFSTPILKFALEKVTGWRVWDDKAQRQILKSRLRPDCQEGVRDDTTLIEHLCRNNVQQTLFGGGGFCRLALLIQQAGTYNVSYTLSAIITRLLLDPTRLAILRTELGLIVAQSANNAPTWRELEKLPYLTAVIKEGLRLAFDPLFHQPSTDLVLRMVMGAMNRSARVSPEVDLPFRRMVLPKGYPISMSSYWMHNDPAVFPEPHIFKPERWLCGPEELKVMNSYFVPFSRGSRMCLAQNFVWMLNYHILAHLFQPGAPDLKLYETDESDVTPAHGYLFVMPKLSSKGVRVTIH